MPTFTCKEEAIAYYKSEKAFENMPDYLVGCLLDFSKKYDNYDEYIEIENKIKTNQKLTKKENKKYGHLDFQRIHQNKKKDEEIPDCVDFKDEHFEKLTDPETFEKYNKYGLENPQPLKPDKDITLCLKTKKGEEYIIKKPIDEIRKATTKEQYASGWDCNLKSIDEKLIE
jgi:hypothetical protein